MTTRHFNERGNLDRLFSLSDLALSLLKGREDELRELYADILMSLSSSYLKLGIATQGLQHAEAHFEQRLRVENAKPYEQRDQSFSAMAYTELSLARLVNQNYEEAVALARQGRDMLEQIPEFKADQYWPHWADFHHAWGLIGLGRAEEARPILMELLTWRERHYGKFDTESMK